MDSHHNRRIRGTTCFLSNRDAVVKRLVSAVNQLHRWVDLVFPEMRQVYKHFNCTGAIATLRLFPTPSELRNMQPQDVIDGWRTLMKRHYGKRRVHMLVTLASSSVGSSQAHKAYKLHLKQLLEEYDLATIQNQAVEQEVIAVLHRILYAKQMLAFKGINAISYELDRRYHQRKTHSKRVERSSSLSGID